jgi:hypothetical protein
MTQQQQLTVHRSRVRTKPATMSPTQSTPGRNHSRTYTLNHELGISGSTIASWLHNRSVEPYRRAISDSSDEELNIGGCCIVKERCCPCDVASFDEV